MEVFLFRDYDPPKPLGKLKYIVDLGANIGCSVVYFAHRYPAAKIDAWEPHPDHIVQLRENIKANELQSRVVVHPVAVGSVSATMWLLDCATQSRLTENYSTGTIEVKVEDWFSVPATKRPIDLLKVDIEGGEYNLLFDPRFEGLDIQRIVLEWHATPQRPHGDQEVADRLSSLGYTLSMGRVAEVGDMRAGLIWDFR